MRLLERKELAAQLAVIDDLIKSLPANDYLGRMSFEAQRNELSLRLKEIPQGSLRRAQVALYFGGDPVIGNSGIEAEFGTKAVGTFQDLVTRVWGSLDGAEIHNMGPIKDKDASQLHITHVVHGSFGFMLEELEEYTEPMFDSPLSKAAGEAADFISTFASENEATFSQLIDTLHPRIFQAMKQFFEHLHKSHATFRLVEGERDDRFDHFAIQRAWNRATVSDISEERITVLGTLLGVIPMKRRFEFETEDTRTVIEGKVGERFGNTYLERINTEQFAGKRWQALLEKRTVKQAGRDPVDKYTLLQLEELKRQM